MAKESHPQALADNYEFPNMVSNWLTYDSTSDPTNIASNLWVRGSLNVYKKLSGTIANRPGQKRLGVANGAFSGVSSRPFVWETSWGETYTMLVSNSTLYAVLNNIWYPLQTGLTSTRYVFDKWYDPTEEKDVVLFVNGNLSIQKWSGGLTTFASGSNAGGSVAQLATAPTVAGSGYSIGDILTITSGGGSGATFEVVGLTTGTIDTPTIGTGNGGEGYTVGDILYLNGGDVASGGSVTVATIGTNGLVASITLLTSGTGFLNGVSYTTSGGTGFGAVVSTAVTTNGAIGAMQLLTPGSGYSAGTGRTTSGGTGSGATVRISAIASGSIKSVSSLPLAENGFSSSGSVVIGASTFAYQYLVNNFMVGINSDPSGIVSGTVGTQTIITQQNTPSFPNSGFTNDYIKVINNQAYVGSYNSRNTFISDANDYTNYVVPAIRITGNPSLVTLDGNGKGIGIRKGNAHIGFGTDSWAIISFADITVGTTLVNQQTVTIKPAAILQAPYAHEFIATVGDSLVYLAQDQQLRSFTDTNNLFADAYPSFSQLIATELSEENFAGGSLSNIGEFTYLCSADSGKTYLYQVRTNVTNRGTLVAERLFHAPFQWNVSAVDQINGIVVGFSNANPQIYQLWDTGQWHDDSPSNEPLPYNSILALSYKGEKRRQGLWAFDKNYSEGYATPNTTLLCNINYNYQGASNVITATVTKPTQLGKMFLGTGQTPSLGDASLGDQPLGDGLSSAFDLQSAVPKFKVINSLTSINCFEYQQIYYSQNLDDRWELLACATNEIVVPNENATFIINKKQI